jgi:hypothetical protein
MIKKNYLVLIACVLSFTYADAQNTFPWPTSGNIGIGTASTIRPLEVRSDNTILYTPVSTTLGVPFLHTVFNNSGGVAGISALIAFNTLDEGGKNDVWYTGAAEAKDPYASVFVIGNRTNGSSYAERLRINSSGNVGIGTTSPTAKVEVFAPVAAAGDRQLLISDGSTGGYFSLIEGTALANAYLPTLDFQSAGRDGSGGYLRAAIPIANDVKLANAGGFTFEAKRADGAALTAANLFVWRNWNTVKMVMDKDGDVGIGTATPDAPLTVNGTIHSTEVRIDNNIPTPDYVFDKNYDLRTLKEVKDYINRNCHLPEIPSAAEVEKNGILLSRMNNLLLKKVEELTLYVIGQDEEIRTERAANESQQKEIELLKKQLSVILSKRSLR